MAKLSDYGERVIPGTTPGEWLEYELSVVAPHEGVDIPHWHSREVTRMRAQLTECRYCGFWFPYGRSCPVCGS